MQLNDRLDEGSVFRLILMHGLGTPTIIINTNLHQYFYAWYIKNILSAIPCIKVIRHLRQFILNLTLKLISVWNPFKHQPENCTSTKEIVKTYLYFKKLIQNVCKSTSQTSHS